MLTPNQIPKCDVCGKPIITEKMDICSLPLGGGFPALVCCSGACTPAFGQAKADFLLGLVQVLIRQIPEKQLESAGAAVGEHIENWIHHIN